MFLPMVSLTFLIAIFCCFADTGVLFCCCQWFVALGTFSGGVGGFSLRRILLLHCCGWWWWWWQIGTVCYCCCCVYRLSLAMIVLLQHQVLPICCSKLCRGGRRRFFLAVTILAFVVCSSVWVHCFCQRLFAGTGKVGRWCSSLKCDVVALHPVVRCWLKNWHLPQKIGCYI